MTKLSVLGTKDFDDCILLDRELNKMTIDVMVVGGKAGPDLLAQTYAIDRDIPIQVFLPDYKLHGRSANYQRNLEMIRQSSHLIIFWNQRSRTPFTYLPFIKGQKKAFRTVMY
ncbi:MAG: hypothetical protein AAGA66_13695 [Bacteroidota bacterium]